jgi:hypothetical protein
MGGWDEAFFLREFHGHDFAGSKEVFQSVLQGNSHSAAHFKNVELLD